MQRSTIGTRPPPRVPSASRRRRGARGRRARAAGSGPLSFRWMPTRACQIRWCDSRSQAITTPPFPAPTPTGRRSSRGRRELEVVVAHVVRSDLVVPEELARSRRRARGASRCRGPARGRPRRAHPRAPGPDSRSLRRAAPARRARWETRCRPAGLGRFRPLALDRRAAPKDRAVVCVEGVEGTLPAGRIADRPCVDAPFVDHRRHVDELLRRRRVGASTARARCPRRGRRRWCPSTPKMRPSSRAMPFGPPLSAPYCLDQRSVPLSRSKAWTFERRSWRKTRSP